MKLQQLRYLVEVARSNLNISEAAEVLYTSQPGVSKQIKLLEDELGIIIFERSGKRLTAITEPGKRVLEIARRLLRETENIKRVGEEYASGKSGRLAIATTHTQARYALPRIVKEFVGRYPKVRLTLHQGNPTQIAEWTLQGKADLAIATELDQYPELVVLPSYQWGLCLIAPDGHPVLAEKNLTLSVLTKWPLITYDTVFSARTRVDQAFERAQLTPNIVLAAIDTDVIKTYVELGLGLGIIADIAHDAERDVGLCAIGAAHLFGSNITRIGLRRGTYLRCFEYDFISLFAGHLTRKAIDMAMSGTGVGDDYAL